MAADELDVRIKLNIVEIEGIFKFVKLGSMAIVRRWLEG